jgi:hypothetical protein
MKTISGPEKKKNEIRRVLRENPQGLTPKYISLYSKINPNTIKTLLKKMPDLKRKMELPGHYILLEKFNHEIFDCKIQNLRFICDSDKINVE